MSTRKDSLAECKAETARRHDIKALAESWNVRFVGNGASAKGYWPCHAIGRKDEKPSAALCVSGQNGALGTYIDHGGGQQSKSVSLYDLGVLCGVYPRWQDALVDLAAKAGVALPKGFGKGGKKSPESLLDQIQLLDSSLNCSRQLIKQWVASKRGVTEAAAVAAGAQVGIWPAKAQETHGLNVIAFLGYTPPDWQTPTAIVLYRANGQDFPAWPKSGLAARKTHLVRGSRDSLIVVGGPERIAAATTIWKVEGLTDALALAAHLPDDHAVMTNTHGAGSFSSQLATPWEEKKGIAVGDADDAGVAGAENAAAHIFQVATETKLVKLPFEHTASHGKDLRDFFAQGRTIEELLAIVEATPALTAAEVKLLPPDRTRRSADDECDDDDDQESQISNAEIIGFGDDATTSPLTMTEVLNTIREKTNDWPRRVDQNLFVVGPSGEISFIPNPPALFGYLQAQTGIIKWSRTSGCITKEETFHELQRTATAYVAIEPLPHHPRMTGHYYACGQPGPGDGQALNDLVNRFKPETDSDRDLIKAALATMFWGGDGGTRPVFVATSDAGRGTGKSTLVKLLSFVAGGALDFSHNEDIAAIKTRLLSPHARDKRVAWLDNVKSLRFSWAELESIVTTPIISGRQLYKGEGSRPNTLTWWITLNGASLSTDMAQRSVIIKLAKPNHNATWEETITKFIRSNHSEIVADVITLLQSPATPLANYSRWAAWEEAVLSRIPDAQTLQRLIVDRQAVVDVEHEEHEIIEDFFRTQLTSLGYSPRREKVFIPSVIAARWFNWATNEKKNVVGACRLLAQFCRENKGGNIHINDNHALGRGVLWVGQEANGNTSLGVDLPTRIADSKKKKDESTVDANSQGF